MDGSQSTWLSRIRIDAIVAALASNARFLSRLRSVTLALHLLAADITRDRPSLAGTLPYGEAPIRFRLVLANPQVRIAGIHLQRSLGPNSRSSGLDGFG